MLETPAAGPSSQGVVLCKPFGQEALRTHRILRVLGERLVAAGFAVLRFDWYATGDSDGDDEASDFEAWIEDVSLADAAIRERAGVAVTRWLGVRLGASLALLAASRAAVRPAAVHAWEPVIDGPAYLAELAAAQRRMLAAGALGFVESLRLVREPKRIAVSEGEALGFSLPSAVLGPLRALGLPAFGELGGLPIDILFGPGYAASDDAETLTNSRGRTMRLDADVAWLIDDSEDFPSVPTGALQAIVARFGGVA